MLKCGLQVAGLENIGFPFFFLLNKLISNAYPKPRLREGSMPGFPLEWIGNLLFSELICLSDSLQFAYRNLCWCLSFPPVPACNDPEAIKLIAKTQPISFLFLFMETQWTSATWQTFISEVQMEMSLFYLRGWNHSLV